MWYLSARFLPVLYVRLLQDTNYSGEAIERLIAPTPPPALPVEHNAVSAPDHRALTCTMKLQTKLCSCRTFWDGPLPGQSYRYLFVRRYRLADASFVTPACAAEPAFEHPWRISDHPHRCLSIHPRTARSHPTSGSPSSLFHLRRKRFTWGTL